MRAALGFIHPNILLSTQYFQHQKDSQRDNVKKITIARISRLCQRRPHLTSSKQTTKSHAVFAFFLPISYCQTMHHRPNGQCTVSADTTHLLHQLPEFHTICKDFQGPFSSVCINMQCTIFEKSSHCFFLIQINHYTAV